MAVRRLAALLLLHSLGCSLVFLPASGTNDDAGNGGPGIDGGGVPDADASTQCPFAPALEIDPCGLDLEPVDLTDVAEMDGQDLVLDTGLDDPTGPLVIALHELVVDAGQTLRIIGRRPLVLISSGDVRIEGELLVEPNADADCPSTDGVDLEEGDASGGAGGSFATQGGAGGGCNNASCLANAESEVPERLRRGCSGGRGGYFPGFPPAAAGAGGGAVLVFAGGDIIVNGRLDASGGGGAGGRITGGQMVRGGGGGGGSGGMVALVAPTITIGGCVSALGGGGGGGSGKTAGNNGIAGQDGIDAACGGFARGGMAGTGGSGNGGDGAPMGGNGGSGTYSPMFGGGGGGGGGGAGFVLLLGTVEMQSATGPGHRDF